MKNANFTESSSTFTVPKGVKKIDVFCVGGGGGGGTQGGYMYTLPTSSGPEEYYTNIWGGGGGGGGYTNTMKNVAVTPGQQLSVVVGAGGAGGTTKFNNFTYAGANGGSGICIIRWGK